MGCGSRLATLGPERTAPAPPIRPTTSAPIAPAAPGRAEPKALCSAQEPAPTPDMANTTATITRLNSYPFLVFQIPFEPCPVITAAVIPAIRTAAATGVNRPSAIRAPP